MILKIKKPITPSQRQLVQLSRKNLNKQRLLKNYLKGLKNSSGRNNSGRITVRHKGGGHKKKFRTLNFFRVRSATGIVCSIEYDPNRNSNIASIFDISTHHFSYILAPKNLKIGDIVKSGFMVIKKHKRGCFYSMLRAWKSTLSTLNWSH